jgi:GTPase
MGGRFPHRATSARRWKPEVEEGNHEYKRHLVSPSAARFQELVTQLQYRLHEGANEALYEPRGVEDDGEIVGLDEDDLEESCKTLARNGRTRSTRTRRSSRNGS